MPTNIEAISGHSDDPPHGFHTLTGEHRFGLRLALALDGLISHFVRGECVTGLERTTNWAVQGLAVVVALLGALVLAVAPAATGVGGSGIRIRI
jgi:hypothetical protein